jgi:hypothetical protein
MRTPLGYRTGCPGQVITRRFKKILPNKKPNPKIGLNIKWGLY